MTTATDTARGVAHDALQRLCSVHADMRAGIGGQPGARQRLQRRFLRLARVAEQRPIAVRQRALREHRDRRIKPHHCSCCRHAFKTIVESWCAATRRDHRRFARQRVFQRHQGFH